MSGYVEVGYSITTIVITSYIAWILARTRAVKRSLDIDLDLRDSDR